MSDYYYLYLGLLEQYNKKLEFLERCKNLGEISNKSKNFFRRLTRAEKKRKGKSPKINKLLRKIDILKNEIFAINIKSQIGYCKNIKSETQYEHFKWVCNIPNYNLLILCVIEEYQYIKEEERSSIIYKQKDKKIATTAKNALISYFDENYEKLDDKPIDTLVEAYKIVNDKFVEINWGTIIKRFTMCTIVALVGSTIYISNIGNCRAILCSDAPVLSHSLIEYVKDSSISDNTEHTKKVKQMNNELKLDTELKSHIVLTHNHMGIDEKLTDNLPIDRAFGHSTNMPEIQKFEMGNIVANPLFCLLLATNGIWHNYDNFSITDFLMHRGCIAAVKDNPDGAQQIVTRLINQNILYSKNGKFSTGTSQACVVYFGKDKLF